MRALLSSYVRARGFVPNAIPEGLAFADASPDSRLTFTLVADDHERAGTRQIVTVHADYAVDGDDPHDGDSPHDGDDSHDGGGAGTPAAPLSLLRAALHSSTPPAGGLSPVPAWPRPWSMARRREATMLINAVNATRLRVGALSLPPMIPCAPPTSPRAVRFSWAVPISSQRDFDLLDTAIDAAREAFATLLPALAAVVLDGYPAAIALGGAPVRVTKSHASRQTG